jgi:hypothetical protein
MDQRPVFTFPWWDLRTDDTEAAHQRNAIQAELATEVGAGHPLQGRELAVVARSESSDDIVVRVFTGGWARVHLTWSGTAQTPPWPKVTFYADLLDLERDLLTPG